MTFVHSEEKRAKDMAYYHSNKERITENRRRRYEQNPQKFIKVNNRAQRKRRTGWTDEEYQSAFIAQSGRCFICEEVPSQTLHADHCHKTGSKRKLLCGPCNKALGMFKDQPQLLEKAAEYLRAHGG